jgi:hypothetical protein
MLSMIANPVTALPVGYPRSGLSRSDLVQWPFSSRSGGRHFGSDRRKSGNSWRMLAVVHDPKPSSGTSPKPT